MRHTEGTPTVRRRAMILVALTLMASLVVPAMAMAATTPRSTLQTSTRLQAKAKRFTISGRVPARYKGKTMTIEVRKPGRTYWDKVGTAKIAKSGKWSYRYTPKLGGKFYIRARYGSSSKLSRTATLTVRRGPGSKTEIFLASTTSTRDSGLFELLKPAFLADCPEYTLKGVFVGSGTAIAYGGSGDADVLLTHSPAAEINFMNGLVGTNPPVPSKYRGKSRYKVMYNHFYLVGTKANPAGISESQSAKSAFQSIATNGSDFWSRNDGSGTNAKEKEIWKSLSPSNPQVGKTWYKATGTLGMAQALANVNNANTGYTLSDSATWLNWLNLQPDLLDAKGKATPDPDTGGYTNIKDVNIKIINQGDATYFNQYSVIEVDGAKNREGAQDFSNWIRSPKAQALIGQYGQVSYGKPLFVPNQGSY